MSCSLPFHDGKASLLKIDVGGISQKHVNSDQNAAAARCSTLKNAPKQSTQSPIKSCTWRGLRSSVEPERHWLYLELPRASLAVYTDVAVIGQYTVYLSSSSLHHQTISTLINNYSARVHNLFYRLGSFQTTYFQGWGDIFRPDFWQRFWQSLAALSKHFLLVPATKMREFCSISSLLRLINWISFGLHCWLDKGNLNMSLWATEKCVMSCTKQEMDLSRK